MLLPSPTTNHHRRRNHRRRRHRRNRRHCRNCRHCRCHGRRPLYSVSKQLPNFVTCTLTVSLLVGILLILVHLVLNQRAAQHARAETQRRAARKAHAHAAAAASWPPSTAEQATTTTAAAAAVTLLRRTISASVAAAITAAVAHRWRTLRIASVLLWWRSLLVSAVLLRRRRRRVPSSVLLLRVALLGRAVLPAGGAALALSKQLTEEPAVLATIPRRQLIGEVVLRAAAATTLCIRVGGAAVPRGRLRASAGPSVLFGLQLRGELGVVVVLRGGGVLVRILLAVDGQRGVIARLVPRRRVRRRRVVGRENRRCRLLPLRLLGVYVDVEPGGVSVVIAVQAWVCALPFFVLVIPARRPAGRHFGCLGRRRARWRCVVCHQ